MLPIFQEIPSMSSARTVLTTGANSGIGLATVLELASRGYRSVGSVRSEEKARIVHDAAAEAGVEVETVLLDVTDRDRCAAVIEDLRPFGVVNNAGYPVTGAIEDVTDEEAAHALETMAIAPLRLARLALPHMREQSGGRIVMVSSIYGRFTTPLTGWYQAAKHALEASSDALRMEVSSDGIAVSLVEPGGIRTALWEEVNDSIDERSPSRYRQAYERMLRTVGLADPMLRDSEEVAKVIATAVDSKRPRSRYVVGIDAQAGVLAERFVPTAVKDAVNRFTLGL
jgi:NAD(P)-dependent dehydrogenase (short-subunit alcohol dehydrogenase family)